MIKLLPKIFIKDYKNIHDPKVRNNYGKLAGIVGIITNVLLSIIKIIAGVLSLSMAIIADGLNNLSDALGSIITFIGFKMAAKPADRDHPFGHQRIEYVTGLIISFLVLFIGASLFKTGIEKIIKPTDLLISKFLLIFLGFSILLKVWQYLYYRRSGKLINSKALLTAAVDSLNDVITTTAVVISLLVTNFFELNIDGYMTVVVAIFILIGGVKLVKETISPLIGEAPDAKFIEKVCYDILSFRGVLGYHDLVVHTYGPGKTFITVHVEVDAANNVLESHNLIDSIERYINDKYQTNLVIHMDPVETKDEYTLTIKKQFEEIVKSIDPVLNFHDFRIVKGSNNINVIFDLEVPDYFEIHEKDLIDKINKKAKRINPKFNLIIIIDVIFTDYE
ncbi:MAG TPA: cation transporter [Acholeplasmataceae bacterium]|nr:cation transporter [Acholeplasmataceae bacterium]